MKTLHTEIEINADAAHVWDVLVDFARYGEWNPFIAEIVGAARQGARLRATLTPPGARSTVVKPRVTEVRHQSVFEWLGHLAVPGLFAGRHRFELHPTSGGTRFVQRETFTGLLVPLLARSLDRHTLAGFRAMNDRLRIRAEETAARATA